MGRYADAVSQIMMEQGRAQAQGQLGSAQAWAGAVQSLGQVPGQILKGHQQQQALDQEQQLRDQQIATNQSLEEQRRAGIADKAELTKQDAALRDYFKDLGDAPPDVKAINGIVGPERGIKIADGFTAMRKLQRAEYTDGQAEVRKVMLGFTALSDPQREAAWDGTRKTLIAQGLMQPADAPETYDPAWWRQKVAEGVEQAKAPAALTPEAKAALEASTAKTVKETDLLGTLTPEQTAAALRFERTQKEVETHNRATEGAAAAAARATASGANRAPSWVTRDNGKGGRDTIRVSEAQIRPGDLPVAGGAAADARSDRRVDSRTRAFEALPQVKRVVTMAEAVGFANGLDANTKNPADDQALIYAYAKAMDPDSVVREGEYATVQKYAQSWAESYKFNAQRIFSNTAFLTPEARANMKQTIGAKFDAGRKQYDAARTSFAKQIEDITGEPNGADHLTDFGAAFPGAPAARPAAAAGPAVGEVRTKNGDTRRWTGSAWVPVR